MVWLGWWVTAAHADMFYGVEEPKPRGAQTVVVTDPASEGPMRLEMPGHDGDTVYVDGWKLGVLPLDTVLAEGLHTFRTEGPGGTLEIQIEVTPSANRTVKLDLTPPKAEPTPAGAPPSAAPTVGPPGS
ncbi:MAG: PEGA domain-containing protein [Myxococcota bacterium]